MCLYMNHNDYNEDVILPESTINVQYKKKKKIPDPKCFPPHCRGNKAHYLTGTKCLLPFTKNIKMEAAV